MAGNTIFFVSIFLFIFFTSQKCPEWIHSGHKNARIRIFFHPDFTVGIGIAPIQRIALADFTAGREFHPALKIHLKLSTEYHRGRALSRKEECVTIYVGVVPAGAEVAGGVVG